MIDISQKRCTKCRKVFPATREYFYSQNKRNEKPRLHSYCKTCHSEVSNKKNSDKKQQQEQKDTKKPTLKGVPDQCASCGTRNGNILGDVDDTTHERYGYLCMKCYRLVHTFQADPKRMRNVLEYIEKTRLVAYN